MSLSALWARQHTHFSASSSSRTPAYRHHFSGRLPRRAAQRVFCQQQNKQDGFHHPEQARELTQEKFPAASEHTPAGAATAIDAYRRDVVPGRVYDSLSFDSQDAERG